MRATIHMAHDNAGLTVSQREAARLEDDAKRRLLSSRKLSLVVDLDQTIIHATVDPTVGEWMGDKNNANYEALSDVRTFQLMDDGPGMHGCWYYIKLRPGLERFLRDISQLYELHIYTMGTRAYAKRIADIVDPTGNLFGDRILSRDESGSLTVKNLQRLFPVDTRMVIIIDDRGDVWRWNPNLIKVAPFDFFIGIGDINSSFLPQQQELTASTTANSNEEEDATTPSKNSNIAQPQVNGTGTAPNPDQPEPSDVSTLEQLVNMGGGDDPGLLQEQTSAQEETIQQQVEDRPLLQKQKELDAEENVVESGDSSYTSENSTNNNDVNINNNSLDDETTQEAIRTRNQLFEDSDRELDYLRERLEDVHRRFFEEYDKRRTRQAFGGRVAELKGEKTATKNSGKDLANLDVVPDVKSIIPQIKLPVLDGVVIVFSGVLPLGTDTQNADISLWAKSFGAVIAQGVNARTTHLVAGRNRTAKVREATRYPKTKIVTTKWLLDSLTRWKHLDEGPYLLPVHPEDKGEPILANPELVESGWLSSSEDDNILVDGEDDDDDDESGLVEMTEQDFLSSGLTSLSPIGIGEDDRDAVDEELKEFLGSDDESESQDDATEAATATAAEPHGTKRKRDNEEQPTEEEQRQELGHSVKPEEEADELEQEMVAAFGDESYDEGAEKDEEREVNE